MTTDLNNGKTVRMETINNPDGSITKLFYRLEDGELIKSVIIPITAEEFLYPSRKNESKTVKCGMLSQADIKGSFIEERDDPNNPPFIRKEYTRNMLMRDFLKEHNKIVRKNIWNRRLWLLINPYLFLKRLLWQGYQMAGSQVILLRKYINYFLSRDNQKKK